MKKKFANILAVAACAGTISACSSQVQAPPPPTVAAETAATATGGVRQKAVTIRATVAKVDQKTRKVDLVGFDGTRETITVGDEVKNLPQVRKGDTVTVTYYQSAAFDVLKKGEKRDPGSLAEGIAAAEPGEMPGAMQAKQMKVVVDVLRLDPEKSTAVVKGPEGNTVSIDIRNPAVFQKVKVGDRVEVTLTEAVAIDVTRAEKDAK